MMALILLKSSDRFSHKKVFFTAGLDFDIRLVNGTETLGRVEVKINNEWGTICGTDFTKNEAVVICKQLGFFDGVALEAGNHGGGSGEVILNGMTCTGRESTLKDCVWSGYKQTSGLCDHSKDAAVRCYTNCELHLFIYILQLLTFALLDSLIFTGLHVKDKTFLVQAVRSLWSYYKGILSFVTYSGVKVTFSSSSISSFNNR